MGFVAGVIALLCLTLLALQAPHIISDISRADPRAAMTFWHASLALILLARGKGRRRPRWLALFLALTAMGGLVSVIDYLGLPAAQRWQLQYLTVAPFAIAPAVLLRFAHSFATPSTSLTSGVDRAPIRTGLIMLLAYAILVAVGELVPVPGAPEVGGFVLFMWFGFAALRSCAHLVVHYRTARPPDDVQIKWTLLAVTIWLVTVWLYIALLWLDLLGVLTLPRSIAIGLITGTMLVGSGVLSFGILAKGTIDPDLALRRSVLAGGLVGAGIFTLGVLEAAISDWVISRTDIPPGASIWIAAGVLAALLHPANEWLRPRVFERFDQWELGRIANEDP